MNPLSKKAQTHITSEIIGHGHREFSDFGGEELRPLLAIIRCGIKWNVDSESCCGKGGL